MIAHARPDGPVYCTDDRCFLEPVQPPAGAPIDDVIDWMRAKADYHDAITSAANRSFARAFRAAVRGDRGTP